MIEIQGQSALTGEISEYALLALREQMSMVLQETHLFRGTIWIIFATASQKLRWKKLRLQARQANAHEFICSLPDGYRSLLGANGTRLSGQRQRIAIARA